MQESEYQEIKGKIITGVFALTSRTIFLQIISFAATFILTILLSPSVFGIFYVVSAVISFMSYFSDIGFAAALVQKENEPERTEYVTAFTIQQMLVLILVGILFYISPYIGRFYKLDSDGIFLLKALLLSFFLSSLKTIPSIQLERKLDFKKLIIPQLFETSIFYVTAIILAYSGLGITSFAYAAIARGIIGLIVIYVINPWNIGIGVSLPALTHLLSYGVPFQLNSILALVKDDLMTIFLGKILPFNFIGYIGWAKKWAEAPLRIIMDSIIRVTFPAYSRLQTDKEILKKGIEKSVLFLSMFIFPITFIMVISIKPLISIIPKYSKWEPALFSYYLFCFSAIFAAFSSPIINALNAIGRIRTTLMIMIVWTVLTWILVPILTYFFGFNGVAMSAFIISFTGVIPIIIMNRIIKFEFFQNIWRQFIVSTAVSVLLFIFFQFTTNILTFLLSLLASIAIFMLIIWSIYRKELALYFPNLIRR